MKKQLLLCALPVLLLSAGCGSDKLTPQKARQLLQQKYPRVIDVLIYTGDPKYAARLQDAGLDADGYVVTKKTKKLGDSTGWVAFTDKASPYLLLTAEADKELLVQKVKAGEEQLAEIVSIIPDEQGGAATVHYTTKVSATPFGKLMKLENGAVKQRTAYFVKSSDNWLFNEKGKH